jgi:two-component system OmpR family response regulator
MRILLVEDDNRIATVIGELLRTSAHQVVTAGTLSAAMSALASSMFDVAIVDVGLPDGSGLDVCRRARAGGHEIPILLLTARNAVDDRVRGLDAGADDYLGKPFATPELSARLRALARRGPRWSESVRSWGTLRIDRDRRTVEKDGVRVPLTPREFDVVALLAWREGRAVTKDEILELIWDSAEGAGASLEVLVARVRRKIDSGAQASCIRTLRHVGYAWAL